jgi:hypothetical protein
VTSCSADALAAHEPLAGTAPLATAWIVIEQAGPWGREALLDSHLDDSVGRHLSAAKGSGVTALLARHPDRPQKAGNAERNVWIARSAPGGMLLRHGLMADVDEIADWDLAAIAAGHLPAFGTIDRRPLTLVCTHSGRDLCCAVHGRALFNELIGRVPAHQRSLLWESSHIGGHRFAPVSLTLPSGAVHGRLDLATASAVLERAPLGEVVLDSLRGRSSLMPPCQVATIEVQRRYSVPVLDDLDVLRVVDDRVVPMLPGSTLPPGQRHVAAEVRHRDGRAWRATLVARDLDRLRLESCGKEPVTGIAWTCVELEATSPWA